MGYNNELEFVGKVDDSYFPDFLFSSLQNDFDVDYSAIALSNDPLVVMARSLKRKYANYFDWLNAMDIYDQYLDALGEKYGSREIVKNSIKIGVMEDILPDKPKLKMNKRNKQFIKADIIPSERILPLPDEEELIYYGNKAFPEANGNDLNDDELKAKAPKASRKLAAKSYEKISGQLRRDSLYHRGASKNIFGSDFIADYYYGTVTKQYDNRGRYTGPQSLTDQVLEDEELSRIPDWLLEYQLDANKAQYINGRYVRGSELQKLEILKLMYEEGYDIFGTFGNKMDNTEIKMIRRMTGDNTPMTEKEKKKWKKDQKKKKKRLRRVEDADRALDEVLFKNRFSVNEMDRGKISLSLKDLTKWGD